MGKFLKEHSYDIFKMMMYQFMMAAISVVMSMATHTNDKLYLATSIIYTIVYIVILYLMTYELGAKDKPAVVGGRAELKPLKGFWLSLTANAVNILCALMIVIFSFFLVYQQPAKVIDDNGKEMEVYISEAENKISKDPVTLYSVSGSDVRTDIDGDYKYPSEVMGNNSKKTAVFDENKNELELYTKNGEQLSTKQSAVENWATNLYGIPYIIATFFQLFYAGIRNIIFNDSIYFFLFTPILPIFFSSLGYYFGVKGKRLFSFLPERKSKPPKYR
ncbi:MAG: hypothetical protein E7652_03875 [Ruminococcaceae bacterium]|nr:hypothetical protein [Oscillospiraceae bacterium]